MHLIDLQANAVYVNALLFALAAVVVWFAGTTLTRSVDDIARRTGLGRALAGFVLLSAATSLPEIATTVTATVIEAPALVTSNLIGGVALQFAVLAIADAVVGRGALTGFVANPALLIQGLLLVTLGTIIVAGGLIGDPLTLGPVGLTSLLLAGAYVIGLLASRSAEKDAAWVVTRPPPQQPDEAEREEPTAVRTYGRFALASAAVLVAGWMVARTGDALAGQTGIGQSVVGGTLVALSTSLPEISTTVAAARMGAYSLAVSGIFGGNAFDFVLLAPVDVIDGGGSLFASIDRSTMFLGLVGILLSAIWTVGLLERRDRAVLRMGIDAWAVVVVYLLGLAIFIATSGG